MSNEREMSVKRRGYRLNDFCEAFQTSRAQAYAMMRAGQLRYVTIGGRRFIPNEVADALLKQD